jgi:hypothetical protein
MSFEYLSAQQAVISNNLVDQTPTSTTTITSSTINLTGVQLAGGILSFSLTGTCTATTPPTTDLFTTFKPQQVGQVFKIYVCFTNSGGGLKTNTGVGVTFSAGDAYTTIVGTNLDSAISHYILLQYNGIVSSNPTWTLYC